ncbi:diphosphomevalonate decarboxylase [Robiginitalea myxolifaciens]|uniref:Diphosphomevalonate decarboxylase n=1 Tax=Robiginitalea myxolifaciens TaxID=400055 RepID=A0A1I6G9U6_9FLAO|nr:diphosphomevalonate decarboxylase [Robiginitalea myxolifaciens]SFR38963.1 diphosphomevalonate decarboxylase [Robiginitalea myxolifaciens]
MNDSEFHFQGNPDLLPDSGSTSWSAPSNIALVKYWGKYPVQLPANPSLSFTLEACATRTTLEFEKVSEHASSLADTDKLKVFLDGQPAPDFEPKIYKFLERISPYMPFVNGLKLRLNTGNTFPHSSGIASSASGMAALSLCLLEIEKQLDPHMDSLRFSRKASFLARLGSGSACRSIEGGLVLWGAAEGVPGSSDLYGITYPGETDPVFQTYHDTILLVDRGKKEVSSTAGHGLMEGHPFAQARFQQARENISRLEDILKRGDLNAFCELVEVEALSLHALMMSGEPSYLLMKPGTLAVIEKVRRFRKESGLPLCFTLDAGANVHLLYPGALSAKVYPFIQQELLSYAQDGAHICDRVGKGARPLTLHRRNN